VISMSPADGLKNKTTSSAYKDYRYHFNIMV